jgi:hypothetical protein
MTTPTQATDNVAHAAVGLAAAIIVPMLVGKGRARPVIAGITGAALHWLLDTRLAKAMANHRLQF